MLKLFYTSFDKPLPPERYRLLLDCLPGEMAGRVERYRRWEDGHASLFGKLLLLHALKDLGAGKMPLSEIKYTQYNRPYLQNGFDFNISHSGNYVVCACSDQHKVGIDIEEIKPVALNDFRGQWTDGEWSRIMKAKESYRQFYRFWTQKEAVIKADGRGLSIPLREIVLDDQGASVGAAYWHLREFPVDDHYMAHLATDIKLSDTIPAGIVNFYD